MPSTNSGPPTADKPRRVWCHLLVLALYSILAVILTWPVVRYLGTHIPGSYNWAFDEYTFVWNGWWFRYSLFNLGQNPLYSTHTFYPLGISLVLYTYNLFNALISVPLQPFLSLPAISNLSFLFATVFSGYGAFLLASYLLRTTPGAQSNPSRPSLSSYLAAFLAGLVFAFGSYRMVYAAIGHYNLWSTAWIPFFILYLVRTIQEPRIRNAIMAGVFLLLTLLCEMMLGVFAALLALILLASVLGKRRRVGVAGGLPALLGRLVVMGLVVLVCYAPLMVPLLRELFGGYDLPGWGDADKLSVDLAGLVTPTALHPLGGDWTDTLRQTREGTSRFRDVNTVFLGWSGLALALVGAFRFRRRLAAWITSGFVFAVLSLGPLLQVNGRSVFDLDGLGVQVPLPFIVLHYLPVIKANRVPNRFGVVLMLALAVLAAYGAYWLLSVVGSKRSRVLRWLYVPLFALLGALLVFDHVSVPLPLTKATIPPVYEAIAAEPGDFAILQLPMGWRNSFGVQGAESTLTQYYQTAHHKRLLSGNISRNPPFKFDYFRGVPILDSLITIQTYGAVDAERRAADRATAADTVRFYDIRYVVVAPGVPGRPPYVDTRDEAVAYIEQVLPVEQIYDQGGWLLYQVDVPSDLRQMVVDLGSEDLFQALVLGEGWGGPEEIAGASARWATGQDARVFLPAAAGANYRLTLTVLPFAYPGAGEQSLALTVNEQRLDSKTVPLGWSTLTWDVPARLLREGLNTFQIVAGYLEAPADVLPGNHVIGNTGVQAPVALEANSGGVAGFAYISVGDAGSREVQDGSIHRSGYNVAVVDEKGGKLLDRQGFDTSPAGNEVEATKLAEYIQAVPAGRIVVFALQDDGTAHLNDAAIAAFRSIGGQLDPRGHAGWSHSIIGVKGAAPGSALEIAGPGSGWLRVAPDWRTLGIAVDLLHWEQAPDG